jgi:hypothetical protein
MRQRGDQGLIRKFSLSHTTMLAMLDDDAHMHTVMYKKHAQLPTHMSLGRKRGKSVKLVPLQRLPHVYYASYTVYTYLLLYLPRHTIFSSIWLQPFAGLLSCRASK